MFTLPKNRSSEYTVLLSIEILIWISFSFTLNDESAALGLIWRHYKAHSFLTIDISSSLVSQHKWKDTFLFRSACQFLINSRFFAGNL